MRAVLPWVLMLLCATVHAGPAPATGKILGGTLTTAYPSVVIVIDQNPGAICSGFVIAPHWVITSAYCVQGPVGDLVVGFGSDFTDPSDDTFAQVLEIFTHPLWVPPSGLENSVSLLHLGVTPAVNPLNVDLGPRGSADVGRRGTAVGFGVSDPNNSNTAQRKRSGLMQISMVDTNFMYAEAATPNLCQGDVGAPFISTHNTAVTGVGVFGDQDCILFSGLQRLDVVASFILAHTTVCPPGTECSGLLKDGFED